MPLKNTPKTKHGFHKGEIIIYKTAKNEVELKVYFQNETVWLNQNEIARLFGKERSVITKHIRAIFKDKEVDQKSNVQFLHIANSDKPVAFYNLDVVLAVGYRTNSAKAIHFRRWATNVVKSYLLKGYALNEKRLFETREKFKELQSAIDFLQKKSKGELLQGQEGEILNLLASYAKTLSTLEAYDTGKLVDIKGKKTLFVLEYARCQEIIRRVKTELIRKKEAGDLFGSERDGIFPGIVRGLYQTFGSKELFRLLKTRWRTFYIW